MRGDTECTHTRQLGWLLHPVTVVATLVLLVNDHLLKSAWPGPVTGKVSDVAGLVVAPPLMALALAATLPLKDQTAAVAALASTGAGFAVVKTVPAAATWASEGWSLLAGHSLVRADPTDLFALPALGIAWWAYRRSPSSNRQTAIAVRVCIVLPLAVLATTATSVDEPASVNSLTKWRGLVVAQGIGVLAASADGTAPWVVLTSAQARDFMRRPPAVVSSGCVPTEPATCYRVGPAETEPGELGEGVRVERSDDGGNTWTTAYLLTPGRVTFLARQNGGGLRPESLVVVDAGDGVHRVLVAMGTDGLLVRGPEGSWHRTAFVQRESDQSIDVTVEPAAPRLFGAEIASELARGLLWVLAAWWLALTLTWRVVPAQLRPSGWARTMAATAVAVILAALPAIGSGWVIAALPAGGLALLLLGGAVIVHVVVSERRPFADLGPRWWLIAATAAAVGLAALPWLGWTVAIPDPYERAELLAVLGTFVGVGLLVAAGLREATRLRVASTAQAAEQRRYAALDANYWARRYQG